MHCKYSSYHYKTNDWSIQIATYKYTFYCLLSQYMLHLQSTLQLLQFYPVAISHSHMMHITKHNVQKLASYINFDL